MATSRAFARASWALLAFTLLVVAWGGLVRASHSGDGCGSHWPTCNGEVFPTGTALKTRIEFTHRVMSGASLVLVLAWAGWALARFPKGAWARRAALATLGLMVVEALLGAGLVLLRLVGTDSSVRRVVGMGLHLCTTFALLAAILLAGLWAHGTARPHLQGQRPVSTLLFISLGALLVVGVTGAIAALGDTLFPARSLHEGLVQDASPAAHFLLRLRILHPVLAAAAASVLLAAAAFSAFLRPSRAVRLAAVAVALAVVTQLTVGLVNLALLAPLPLQLVHLVLADVVWLSVVGLAAQALAEDAPRLLVPTAAASALGTAEK